VKYIIRKKSFAIAFAAMCFLLLNNNSYANFVQSLKDLGFESYYVSPGIGITSHEEPSAELSAGYTQSIFFSGALYTSCTHIKDSDKAWRMNSGLQMSFCGAGFEAGYTYLSRSTIGFIYGYFVSIPFKGLLFSFSDEEYPRFQPYLVLYYRNAPGFTGEKYSEYGIMLKCPIFLD
jgi:hypothetical protein